MHKPDAGALVKIEWPEHSSKLGLNPQVRYVLIPAQVRLLKFKLIKKRGSYV